MDLTDPQLATMGLWMYFWTAGDWGEPPEPPVGGRAGKYVAMRIIGTIFGILMGVLQWM